MATLIKLTIDGQNRSIWLNADYIVSMERIQDRYTAIKMAEEKNHTVVETPEQIQAAAARRAAG